MIQQKILFMQQIADPVEDLMRDLEDTEQQTPSNKAKIGDSMVSKVKITYIVISLFEFFKWY